MYSGAKAGLVLTDIQQEHQELKNRDQEAMAFEGKNVKVQKPVQAHVAFLLFFLKIYPTVPSSFGCSHISALWFCFCFGGTRV
jgi:hypothetical protein